MVLYDDYAFPTGTVGGGQMLAKYPQYMAHNLVMHVVGGFRADFEGGVLSFQDAVSNRGVGRRTVALACRVVFTTIASSPHSISQLLISTS